MDSRLKTVKFIAELMDTKFKVGKISFGFDPILSLIPGGGTLFSLGFSLYIVLLGINMGLPIYKVAQMGFNVFMDTLIGAIPFIGALFDVGFKGNIRNLKIIESYTLVKV
jgi:hypothetical protein